MEVDVQPNDANGLHQTQTCIGEQNGVWYCGEGDQKHFFFRQYRKRVRAHYSNVYVYCVLKHTRNCPAKGKIIINHAGVRGPLVLTHNVHNHPKDPFKKRINEIYQILARRAALETTPLKRIYDEELYNEPAPIGAAMPYRSVLWALYKRRQKAQPTVPDNILDLVTRVRRKMPQWFRTQEGNPFLAAYRDNAMLFVSPFTQVLLGQNDLLFTMDGTFKVTPNKPKIYQVYTLGAVYRNVFIPIAFGILQDKNAATYRWMFEELQKVNPDWNPQMIMTDFETGAIAAIRHVFPQARHIGCWFHYSKAIQKQCGKLNLIQPMRNNPNLKRAIRKLMALPLLPSRKYIRGYRIIEQECQDFLDTTPGLAELLNYVRTFWIQRITPNMISVYDAPSRTNNLQEAYHGNITLHVADSRRMVHPRFWRFLEALRIMEHDAHIKLLAATAGKNVSYPRKRRWILQNRNIEQATQQFDDNMNFAQNVMQPEIRAELKTFYIKTFLERAKYFFNFPEVEVPLQNQNEDEDPDLPLQYINQIVEVIEVHFGEVDGHLLQEIDDEENEDNPVGENGDLDLDFYDADVVIVLE
ncbi:uncharacterized protein LOC135835422 [Planococcus citri]|uniref:uncharacterized protein LOC135835422 n=1 Tax=Planococcus citri TaxID=170843 RepID=UPI0031F96711